MEPDTLVIREDIVEFSQMLAAGKLSEMEFAMLMDEGDGSVLKPLHDAEMSSPDSPKALTMKVDKMPTFTCFGFSPATQSKPDSKAMPPPVLLPNGYAACHAVIGDAINRCRHSDNLSRVTIVIKHLENNPPALLSSFEVLVSDTGPGISREEVSKLFQDFSSAPLTHLCDATLFWGGEMVILTSEFPETEVRQYRVTNAFNQTTIMQLRSLSKDSGRFSGSSIVLNFKGYPRELLLYICDICCKIKILMSKTVAVEVCVERLTSESTVSEDVLLVCEGLALPPELSNLDRLSVGMAAYASRSVNANRVTPKIGKALAASSESSTETHWFFEACFAVTEAMNSGDISMETQVRQTKVLFFQDFICTAVTPTIVQTLKTKVNWESFGLYIKDVQLLETGTAIIEWEGSTRLESIELALHRYRSHQIKAVSWSREVSVCKRCVEDALHDLKLQNPHLFISHQSSELQKHVPDLSSCLAKLISASSDVAFKASCAEILGLVSADFNDVDLCIRAKINAPSLKMTTKEMNTTVRKETAYAIICLHEVRHSISIEC
ncbi:hypothetical protein GOP47_0008788 [Adiantum capillus-veneris]|uniref:Uncharacterized protein n=1 Tax=Adiantum capillus-veneris TaxID=13818 RepID=A0A9D4UZ86_ADICA|nr:hypothetical protein GOP47_0008788 [Adiantum capillus-veneris]